MPDTMLPTSGLSDWQLKLSYFYVSNKLLLRKLLVLLLILINFVFWGYSVTGLLFWALDYQRLTKQTTDLMFSSTAVLPLVEALKPKPLNLSTVNAFSGNGNLFDLMADVVNPNPDWLARFDYSFVGGSVTSTKFSSFVLPGDHKILLDLGRASAEGQLEVTNIKWQRVSGFTGLRAVRDRFTVTNEQFLAAPQVGDPSRVRFTIKNDSSFSYWETGVTIVLYNGGSIVGVNFLTIPQFKSGDQRDVEMNWTKAIPQVDTIEVIPAVNYLDSANIIPPASS